MVVFGLLVIPSLPIQKAEAAAGALYVNAYDMSKSQKYSMWVTIHDQWGNLVQTGFTPLTYSGINGITYTVTVANYGSLNFDHWGNGSTNPARKLTVGSSNVWFDAYYRSGSVVITPTPGTNIQTLLPKTGAFVALYMYPGGSGWQHWQAVIDAKKAHPSVPIVAVINPNSGPGNWKDSNFANGIPKLRNVGVIVLGYTYSDYGARSLTVLKGDVDKYQNWYGIDGIFIDEFNNQRNTVEWQYDQITDYAKSRGMKMVMGNPGTDVPESYINTADVMSISEGRGYLNLDYVKGWHLDYDKRNFGIIRYDIGWLDTNYVIEASKYVGLIYITNGNDSNHRWFHVPSWFDDMVGVLDR
jgi:hypothetical protein